MTSLYHFLPRVPLTVMVTRLLSPRILQKNLSRWLISFAFFAGIVLLIGLITIPVSKADCDELVVKELKFMQVPKAPTCDPNDDGCNTEK